MTTTLDRVRERLLLDGLDELAGRAVPIDRTDAILDRVAARGTRRKLRATAQARRIRSRAAALLLLGITVAVGVTTLTRKETTTPQEIVARPMTSAASSAPQSTSTPHPKGTSPEDLRAARGAEAMLAAEARLEKAIAEGRVAGAAAHTPFAQFGSWRYRNGLDGIPADVRALDDTTVVLAGFMLPLDEVENMREFLLVPSLWSCCYGTPPDINQIVRVVMNGDATANYTFEPVMVVGTFTVSATFADGYCVDIFQLHAGTVAPIQ